MVSRRVLHRVWLPAGPATLTLVALAVWAIALPHLDATHVGGLGLIEVVGPLFILSLVLLCVAFGWGLALAKPSARLCAFQVVALIVVLNTLAAIVETEPSYFSAYLHAGFIQYIAQHGSLLPRLDARFSWPGSFSLGAMIMRTAGLQNAVALIRWAPLFFELLYLAPVLAITRAAVRGGRVRWAAVWLFYVANWIGQDYLSPQALNFFFVLVVVAAVLHWSPRARVLVGSSLRGRGLLTRFRRRVGGDEEFAVQEVGGLPSQVSPWRRVLVIVAIVVITAVITISHQVSPVILAALFGAMWLTGRAGSLRLPVMCVAMFLGYLSLGAQEYWVGHLDALLGSIGHVNQNLSANLGGRIKGSDVHRLVLDARIGLVLVMAALGAVGLLRAWRAGHNRLSWAFMAVAPFPLFVLQSYGGEAVLRSYLFTLPFLSILAAHAFFVATRRSVMGAIALSLISSILAVGFITARYGNDQFEQVAPSEADAVAWIYGHAPLGSTIVAASRNLPWRYRDIDTYHYNPADDAILSNPDSVIRLLEGSKGAAFFISTKAEEVFGEELYGLAPGWLDALDAKLESNGRVQVVFREGDARVYALYGALRVLP